MIRKLKRKFILLSMTALTLLLAVILVGMNLINYTSVVDEADEILSILSHNKGTFPELGDRPGDKLPPHMSPETPYESRFFSVAFDGVGNVIRADTGRISAVDEEAAIAYARQAIRQEKERGFVDRFRYAVTNEVPPGGDGASVGTVVLVTCLDCTRSLESFYTFLRTGLLMAVAGLVVVFVIIFVLSERIIRPIAESYEKQKRFITDAGHEIKTPLTVIGANADLLEMELGEGNESLTDIKDQVIRLRALTDDLVLLARMEESNQAMPRIDFPFSEVVADAVHPFAAPAEARGLALTCHIQPLLTLCGNERSIRQLVSILLDNALKYAAPNSEIEVCVARQGHAVVLTVSNRVAVPLKAEQLERVFDRFYRADASRNSETGGHGIGLSVARAIVDAHGGKIAATSGDGHMFAIRVAFS